MAKAEPSPKPIKDFKGIANNPFYGKFYDRQTLHQINREITRLNYLFFFNILFLKLEEIKQTEMFKKRLKKA